MSVSNVITGIDIGSTKICAVIATRKGETLCITGVGQSKSAGLKKGAVTNIEQASRSIRQALTDAKRVAGIEIQKAIVSISGTYTKSFNSHGIVTIPTKEITIHEIARVISSAVLHANTPSDYEIIHALPYNFKVDDQDAIEDPIGMSGSRLEVSIHIIAAQKSSLENMIKSVRGAGIEIEAIVSNAYAATIATIGSDEKELGAAVIDIGGATSNIAVHLGNSLKYDTFVAIGSGHITSDLSMALHTPIDIAEKIKIEYGSLSTISHDNIEIPLIGDETRTQTVSLEIVSNVIYARVEETLMILAKKLEQSGFKNQLGAGIVLTGGMTKLEGLRDLAVPIFDNMPVRIGRPRDADGLFDSVRDPAFSAAIGLVLYGLGDFTLYEIDSNKKIKTPNPLSYTQEESILKPFEETYTQENDFGISTAHAVSQSSVSAEHVTHKNESATDFDNSLPKLGGMTSEIRKLWQWATKLF